MDKERIETAKLINMHSKAVERHSQALDQLMAVKDWMQVNSRHVRTLDDLSAQIEAQIDVASEYLAQAQTLLHQTIAMWEVE